MSKPDWLICFEGSLLSCLQLLKVFLIEIIHEYINILISSKYFLFFPNVNWWCTWIITCLCANANNKKYKQYIVGFIFTIYEIFELLGLLKGLLTVRTLFQEKVTAYICVVSLWDFQDTSLSYLHSLLREKIHLMICHSYPDPVFCCQQMNK